MGHPPGARTPKHLLTCTEYIKGDRFSSEFVEKRRMEYVVTMWQDAC